MAGNLCLVVRRAGFVQSSDDAAAVRVRPLRVPFSVLLGIGLSAFGVIALLSGGFGWMVALLVPALVLSFMLCFHTVRKLWLWDQKSRERKEED